MASTPDGPRYIASLQDVIDLSCYKDFFESEKFEVAKVKAEDAAEKHQRSAIVYDRKLMAITHKKVIEKEKKVEEKPQPKKGKKSKEKKITKDDYFE